MKIDHSVISVIYKERLGHTLITMGIGKKREKNGRNDSNQSNSNQTLKTENILTLLEVLHSNSVSRWRKVVTRELMLVTFLVTMLPVLRLVPGFAVHLVPRSGLILTRNLLNNNGTAISFLVQFIHSPIQIDELVFNINL